METLIIDMTQLDLEQLLILEDFLLNAGLYMEAEKVSHYISDTENQ